MRVNFQLGLVGVILLPWMVQAGTVTAYGPAGTLGDSLTCTAANSDDETLADQFAMENSNEATRDGNVFHYKKYLPCGKDYARAVAVQCAGLDGTPKCHESLLRRDTDVAQAISPNEKRSLQRRSAYYCKDISQECQDVVDVNAFAECPSGYTRIQLSDVKGYHTGFLCERPCSADMKAECLRSVCHYRRSQCAQTPGHRTPCLDALIKCRDDKAFLASGIATSQDACTDANFQYVSQISDCKGCVHYKDGVCRLDNLKFDSFLKRHADESQRLIVGLLNGFGAGRD